MNYKEAVDYLFNCAPLFQQVGSAAYKEGLENTLTLDEHFGHPHRTFKTIHIAGTNGKGSCSHTLAAILQAAGYKVGLYTSPHLIDFRERIRVNGVPVSEEFVVSFVANEREFYEKLHPSFFELTTAIAFNYFALQKVDVAVVEVGLGGRLDCTNIISPDLSIITNISLDHTQFLGTTLPKIAGEKAGIIKPDTPVVIGETTEETRPVFEAKAKEANAPIYFAEEEKPLIDAIAEEDGFTYLTKNYGTVRGELSGDYQKKNTNTILTAVEILKSIGYRIPDEALRKGFTLVTATGLMGRWQKISSSPRIICDAGHNSGGIKYVVGQLARQKYKTLHFVAGMVNDKDTDSVLAMLPKNATYYFTRASVKRALTPEEFAAQAAKHGLKGQCYPDVKTAVETAKRNAAPDDLIFVGGSCFIVADLLASMG